MSTRNKQIFYRAHNNYDVEDASNQAVRIETEPSLTIQAQAEDADINVLMRRYGITGKMPENVKIPTYADFTDVYDYRTALEATRRIHNDFMEIPAEIRAKFDNDPQLFMEFAANPDNIPAGIQLGIFKRKENASTNPTPTTQTGPTTQVGGGNPGPTGGGPGGQPPSGPGSPS